MLGRLMRIAMPRRGHPVGSLLGVGLRIQPASAVVGGFLTLIFMGQFATWTGDDTPKAVLFALGTLGYVGMIVSLLAHEFAHILAGRAFGMTCTDVILTPFGMVASIKMDDVGPWEEVAIALAGPLMSVALGALAWWISGTVDFGAVHLLALLMVYVNAGLAIFNMIPCYPMDGGRVVRGISWAVLGSKRMGTLAAAIVGVAGGLGIMGIGVIQLLSGNVMGLATMVIAVLMMSYAWSESIELGRGQAKMEVTAREIMSSFGDPGAPNGVWLSLPGNASDPGRVEVWKGSERVMELGLGDLGTVAPGDRLQGVMDTFMARGAGGWPVVVVTEGGVPLGYVSHGTVMERLG